MQQPGSSNRASKEAPRCMRFPILTSDQLYTQRAYAQNILLQKEPQEITEPEFSYWLVSEELYSQKHKTPLPLKGVLHEAYLAWTVDGNRFPTLDYLLNEAELTLSDPHARTDRIKLYKKCVRLPLFRSEEQTNSIYILNYEKKLEKIHDELMPQERSLDELHSIGLGLNKKIFLHPPHLLWVSAEDQEKWLNQKLDMLQDPSTWLLYQFENHEIGFPTLLHNMAFAYSFDEKLSDDIQSHIRHTILSSWYKGNHFPLLALGFHLVYSYAERGLGWECDTLGKGLKYWVEKGGLVGYDVTQLQEGEQVLAPLCASEKFDWCSDMILLSTNLTDNRGKRKSIKKTALDAWNERWKQVGILRSE